MFSGTIIALLLVAVILWLWQSNMRSREIALDEAKTLCKMHKAQLLDATVSMKKLAFRRREDGRMAFLRVYVFEYTLDKSQRLRGRVAVHGLDVTESSLQWIDGASTENHVRLEKNPKPNTTGKVIDFKQYQSPKNDERIDPD